MSYGLIHFIRPLPQIHFILLEMLIMKIVGIRKSDFTARTGEPVKGYTVYVMDNIVPQHGQGQSAEHFYLSQRKLTEMNGIDPFSLLGHEVKLYYNRYGKVDTVEVLD